MRDMLLILSYDDLSARIAARKLRAERISCRIVPWNIDAERLQEEAPSGILLCASADTRNAEIMPAILDFDGPVLALGTAAASLNAALGGQNGPYSPITEMKEVDFSECPLLNGMSSGQRLIRGLIPMRMTREARLIATMGDARTVIGFSMNEKRRFGLQMELEPHDPDSTRLLTNFALNIAGCTPWCDDEAFVRQATDEIRRAAGDGNAVCMMTGGLYSNVAALLAARALGSRLTCVFVETGLLQEDQEDWFLSFFQEKTGLDVVREDHRDRFLRALAGVRDKMEKRRTIESMYTVIRRDVQRAVPRLNVVVRGRSYIERLTEGEEMNGLRAGVLCVEPLRDLFMEEVRQIGRYLGMPDDVLYRQAIPATGLALNITGEVTQERLEILRKADRIFRRLMEEENQARRMSAYFAALEPEKTGYTVSLHALMASDAGVSRAARVPYDILENAMEQIRSGCQQIVRVVYDMTPDFSA